MIYRKVLTISGLIATLVLLAGCNQGANQTSTSSVAPFLKIGETICINQTATGKVLAVSGDFVKLEPEENGKFLPQKEGWANVGRIYSIQNGACEH